MSSPRLRLLEVAAMPFPSSQGTQAFVREQNDALARRGHEVHLLVYAHGDNRQLRPAYTIHRIRDWPKNRSLRSGPSFSKVALDLQLAWAIRSLDRRLRPHLVHAHNYEALVASLAARPRAKVLYHAHTLFGFELPTYLPQGSLWRSVFGLAGAGADALFPRCAAATVSVCPSLSQGLVKAGHPRDKIVTILPGSALPSRTPSVRQAPSTIGYCGNLDGYQGIEALVAAFAELTRRLPGARLHVVTDSNPGPLWTAASRYRGVTRRIDVVPHGTDQAAVLDRLDSADLCVVPRGAPGGFPMKILTYFAAGKAVVSTKTGAAGLRFGDAAVIVADESSTALARAMERELGRPERLLRRGRAGQELLKGDFSWDAYCHKLEVFVGPLSERKAL